LDLSQVVAGPLAGQLLAEQGADVIKVEPIGGELMRVTGTDHVRGLYANCNRGKRCLALDLDTEAGREVALSLSATCDVVVQNFRPGVVERLGVGPAAVAERNPAVIYCSISGFGPTGPYSQRAVLDPVIQGLTGLVAGQSSEALPFPDLVRTLVADKATAYTAAQQISAALFARERGAGGQHIELAMLDATLAWFWPDGMADHTHVRGQVAAHRPCDLYQLIDTVDGQVVYFLANQRQFEGMWRALGRDDLLDDPNYCKPALMAGNVARAVEIATAIRNGLSAMTTADAVDRMAENSVPGGPVLDRLAVLSDAQVLHNALLVEWEHPSAGVLLQAGPPGTFSATPPEFLPMIGAVGQHTDEILSEIGHDVGQIATLRGVGVVA